MQVLLIDRLIRDKCLSIQLDQVLCKLVNTKMIVENVGKKQTNGVLSP